MVVASAGGRVATGGGARCLKLGLTDGHAAIVGLEAAPLPELQLTALSDLRAERFKRTLDRLEAEMRKAFASAAPEVTDIAARYEAALSRIVFRCRREEHASHPELGAPDFIDNETAAAGDETAADAKTPASDEALADDTPDVAEDGSAEVELLGITEEDRAPLLAFRRTWFMAVGLWLTRRRADAYAGYLRRLKDRRLGVSTAPARAERDKTIAAAAAKLRTSGDIAF
jgi:hypothetical protein